jgi:NAD(P)-dependent dehydrogenase (short-subunit alcohol dehydrogenase family)
MHTLAGKTAVVTGGGSGIGRALAQRLVTEGMKVAILDVQAAAASLVAEELRAAGRDATAFQVDVTDRKGLARVVAAVEERYGGVDLLCNNAGVTTFGKLLSLQDGDWDWELAVNLRGAIDVVRAFLPGMMGREGERHIVTTASIAGLVAGFTSDIVPYSIAKAGAIALSEALRLELADSGIGVSVLCPAGVRTNIILSGERRPAEMGGATPIDSSRHQRTQDTGLDPTIVADMVIQAVRANRFYIFTSARSREPVEQRIASLHEGFEALDLYLAASDEKNISVAGATP